MVALYHGSLTLENFRSRRGGVLQARPPSPQGLAGARGRRPRARATNPTQVLARRHSPLVDLLGRRSGRDVDKLAQIVASGLSGIEHRFGVPTLADCLGGARRPSCEALCMGSAPQSAPVRLSALQVELRLLSEQDVGDHVLALCEVGDGWSAPERVAQPAGEAWVAAQDALSTWDLRTQRSL